MKKIQLMLLYLYLIYSNCLCFSIVLNTDPLSSKVRTKTTSCVLPKTVLCSSNKKKSRWRRRKYIEIDTNISFSYQYDELILLPSSLSSNHTAKTTTTTTYVLLIHPIGVGIAKWYYDRLFHAILQQQQERILDNENHKYVFLAPDLLGSGSACNPKYSVNDDYFIRFPLLYVTDWSTQLIQFMKKYCEQEQQQVRKNNDTTSNWCIVSNGGCVPIALAVAADCCNNNEYGNNPSINITNIILSSPPSIQGLLSLTASTEQYKRKVKKSYRTLSGWIGKLFWWYALRNDGTFIQKFSIQNLAANVTTLGDIWQSQCVQTAMIKNSRYSTFAFLAGALRCNCQKQFSTLKNKPIKIDVISGKDRRQNTARSWFWSRNRRRRMSTIKTVTNSQQEQSNTTRTTNADGLSHFLQTNGNRGKKVLVGGRICLAHEDPIGYAHAIFHFLK